MIQKTILVLELTSFPSFFILETAMLATVKKLFVAYSRQLEQLKTCRNWTEFLIYSTVNILGVFKVCLELLSDSNDQFGFVVGEFSERLRTRKSPCS